MPDRMSERQSSRRRRLWRAGGLVALVAAGSATLLLTEAGASRTPTPGSRVQPMLAQKGIKPLIAGLIDKGSQAPYTHGQPFPTVNLPEVRPYYAAFSGVVINETWAQLEPSQGNFTFDGVRKSLAAVSAYNRAHPSHQLRVKLRIFGGFAAPEWAKTMEGPPIRIATKILASGTGTVGQWWKPGYRAAWSALQHSLAASFDGNRLIGSVAVSSCATLTAEPFVINLKSSVRGQLAADGWSWTAERQCLEGAFSDYSGWKRTSIDYTFNPLPSEAATAVSSGSGSTTPSTAAGSNPAMSITSEVMSQCASLLSTSGRACVLSNHALRRSAASSPAAPVYSEIDKLYSRHRSSTTVDFQTFDQHSSCPAIGVAVKHHALSVELWPPTAHFRGYAAQSPATLFSWSRALRRGQAPSC
jgi:hypothetical protein